MLNSTRCASIARLLKELQLGPVLSVIIRLGAYFPDLSGFLHFLFFCHFYALLRWNLETLPTSLFLVLILGLCSLFLSSSVQIRVRYYYSLHSACNSSHRCCKITHSAYTAHIEFAIAHMKVVTAQIAAMHPT